ncbi:reverse transcriptase [Sclerotinia sclerotiorum 1980 UF-70]|uniref:Reverse transcriptase n=1 Tax=Sclerotinia sclerotiorum (strain ATCC 18683 / 1980 / Ss-1) TaxID=665079 RepID=A7EW16_SCLS1|nr:reverse transcriptase [Sclerotinia sclerotiorum 1980 UF-70]EDN93658.1 reverse transcriptase [Sclerotinia sclerotiorum 1980 UF-70]
MYNIKRMGDIGEPCGSPHSMFVLGPVVPSRRTWMVLRVTKEDNHLVRLGAQPCSRSLRIRRPGRTASKAPLISRVSNEAEPFKLSACSTSWVRQVVRSTEDLRGRAPNWCVERTLWEIEVQDICRAINRSSPLPRTESRAMGLYDLGEERSALLGLGMIARIALRKDFG